MAGGSQVGADIDPTDYQGNNKPRLRLVTPPSQRHNHGGGTLTLTLVFQEKKMNIQYRNFDINTNHPVEVQEVCGDFSLKQFNVLITVPEVGDVEDDDDEDTPIYVDKL